MTTNNPISPESVQVLAKHLRTGEIHRNYGRRVTAEIIDPLIRAYLALSERNLDLEAVNYSLRETVRDAAALSERVAEIRELLERAYLAMSERIAELEREIEFCSGSCRLHPPLAQPNKEPIDG